MDVQAQKNGVVYDPSADTVQLAFMAKGAGPPGSNDWVNGVWDVGGSGISARYRAGVLVGPGGAKTLGVGTYLVWVKIADNPETPVKLSPDTLIVE